MNPWPTSGPIMTSRIHQAREASSSRISLAARSALRERKEDLLEPALADAGLRAQLVESAFARDASAAEQDQTVADARRVGQLVNGEEERASGGRGRAENCHHVAGLA